MNFLLKKYTLIFLLLGHMSLVSSNFALLPPEVLSKIGWFFLRNGETYPENARNLRTFLMVSKKCYSSLEKYFDSRLFWFLYKENIPAKYFKTIQEKYRTDAIVNSKPYPLQISYCSPCFPLVNYAAQKGHCFAAKKLEHQIFNPDSIKHRDFCKSSEHVNQDTMLKKIFRKIYRYSGDYDVPSGSENELEQYITSLYSNDFCELSRSLMNSKFTYGITPLMWAILLDQDSIVTLLFRYFKNYTRFVNARDEFGNSAFTWAIHSSSFSIVSCFLQKANLKVKKEKEPCLNLAKPFLHLSHPYSIKVWKALKKAFPLAGKIDNEKVSRTVMIQKIKQSFETPLMKVAHKNDLPRLLMYLYANNPKTWCINERNLYGYTALMCAVSAGKMSAVKLILEHPDVDLTVKDIRGYSAFRIATCGSDIWRLLGVRMGCIVVKKSTMLF